jgi:hypothetical protein
MSEAMYRTKFHLKTVYHTSEQMYQVRKVFVVRVVITGTQKKEKVKETKEVYSSSVQV